MPLDRDSFWMRRLFNVCVRVFCAPNATLLLVYIPAKIKMSCIWKDDIFLPKSASSVSRSLAHLAQHCSSVYTTILVLRKDKTNYLSNQTHELSVTIHKISTSWKKNVRWRTLHKPLVRITNQFLTPPMLWELLLQVYYERLIIEF